MTRRLAALVLGPGIVLGAALAAAPAQAAPAPAAAATATGADSADERSAVADSWTAERMRAATPGSVLVEDAAAQAERALASGTPSSAVAGGTAEVVDGVLGAAAVPGGLLSALAPTAAGVPWAGGGQVVATTGKVFFTLGGADYVCSASSVASDNLSTVLTAGHCLYGEGAFASDFVFVPGYDEGAAPYGRWTATDLVTTPQWEASEDLNFDVGFAVVGRNGSGQALADVVGAQGIGFNQARGQQTYAFGYPAAAPYDGESLQYCAGVVRDDLLGSTDQGLTCGMTGGSSGGPWYSGFDEATGSGVATSVNSFKYTADPTTMYGPYLGDQASATYATAAAS